MSTQIGSPSLDILTGAALEPFRAVKLSGSSFVYAGAGEEFHAVTADRAASGDKVAAWARVHNGTVKMTASAAISAGADVFLTANGKIDDAPGGVCIGRALQAASGDGAIIEVLLTEDNTFVATGEYNASSVNKTFFIATAPMKVTAIIPRVTVAGTDGSAVTAVVRKVPSGTAITGGTALHSGSFDLKGTANTNQSLTLSTTAADLLLATGDAIAIHFTGTLTSATGVIAVFLRAQ